MLVLTDTEECRRLQITLRLEDAVVVGQELAGRPSQRSGLYRLIDEILRCQAYPVQVNLALGESDRAAAALVLGTEDGTLAFPTSPSDGIALAVRAQLPICAEAALMDRFGVSTGQPPPAPPVPQTTAIPEAFRLALESPPEDGGR
jgi:bifunctional DNase/RNase